MNGDVSTSCPGVSGPYDRLCQQCSDLRDVYARNRAKGCCGQTKQSRSQKSDSTADASRALELAAEKLLSLFSQGQCSQTFLYLCLLRLQNLLGQEKSRQPMQRNESTGESDATIAGFLTTICKSQQHVSISITYDRGSSYSMKLTTSDGTIRVEHGSSATTSSDILKRLLSSLQALSSQVE